MNELKVAQELVKMAKSLTVNEKQADVSNSEINATVMLLLKGLHRFLERNESITDDLLSGMSDDEQLQALTALEAAILKKVSSSGGNAKDLLTSIITGKYMP